MSWRAVPAIRSFDFTDRSNVLTGIPRALVAQLVEHLICNQGVGGSSPSGGTIFHLYDLERWVTACTQDTGDKLVPNGMCVPFEALGSK